MEGLTNENALKEVQKLSDLLFDANALADRMVYVLDIQYNCVDFNEWFHHNIAHWFPIVADHISDYASLRQDLLYRGEIKRHEEEYSSISQLFEKLVLKVKEIENQCVIALHSCADNGNEGFEDFLRDFNIKYISPMLKQCIVFYNASVSYERNNAIYKWNKDFEAYILPQFREVK